MNRDNDYLKHLVKGQLRQQIFRGASLNIDIAISIEYFLRLFVSATLLQGILEPPYKRPPYSGSVDGVLGCGA